ncbi:hypothetical protein AB0395_44640 [Streptosporangium sp. NPDC051023]|uniref:hypothetical protein n=1 Tax=Streptosporangium sp. NPDC051023 TaxID=3155410 RepID=UPI003450813B
MSTTPERRTAFVTGLRDLADFIEANPGLPIPRSSAIINYFPERTTDTEMCADIDQVAGALGTEIDPVHLPHGHYMTSRNFGPISYEAVAILTDARARYDADNSYQGCVVPDTDTIHAA